MTHLPPRDEPGTQPLAFSHCTTKEKQRSSQQASAEASQLSLAAAGLGAGSYGGWRSVSEAPHPVLWPKRPVWLPEAPRGLAVMAKPGLAKVFSSSEPQAPSGEGGSGAEGGRLCQSPCSLLAFAFLPGPVYGFLGSASWGWVESSSTSLKPFHVGSPGHSVSSCGDLVPTSRIWLR